MPFRWQFPFPRYFDCKYSRTPERNAILFFSPSLLPTLRMVASQNSVLPHDREKGLHFKDETAAAAKADVAPDLALVQRYGRLGPFLAKLFESGVEARGVERVPEDQRETKNMWNK